jgi:hypothetical protein
MRCLLFEPALVAIAEHDELPTDMRSSARVQKRSLKEAENLPIPWRLIGTSVSPSIPDGPTIDSSVLHTTLQMCVIAVEGVVEAHSANPTKLCLPRTQLERAPTPLHQRSSLKGRKVRRHRCAHQPLLSCLNSTDPIRG